MIHITQKEENGWIGLPSESELDQYVGYVYCITNLANGRKYLGQKKLWRIKKLKPLKGKKKKRHFVVPSDYKDYYGSNELLKSDFQKLGKNLFERRVIIMCKKKCLMNYWETWHQMNNDVLGVNHPPNAKLWYNNYIGIRMNGNMIRGNEDEE